MLKLVQKVEALISIDHVATGCCVREYRKSKKLKIKDVAHVMNCTVTYLSHLELGRRKWNEERLNKVVNIIDSLSHE